jgi:hypothetical protein
MQPRRTRALFLVALTLAGVLSLIRASHAETYVGRLIAEDLFDRLKFSGRIAVWPADAAQARDAGLTPSAAAALCDKIRTEIQQIGAKKGFSFVEREAISKVFQEQQFAHNAKDSDFETLAHDANADALVLVSLYRKDPAEIAVSARLVKTKGTAAGQVLVASQSYDVPMTEISTAAVSKPQPQVAAAAPPPAAQPRTVTPTNTVTAAPYYAPTYAYAYTVTPTPVYAPPSAYAYAAPVYAPAIYYPPRVRVAVRYGRWWR